MKNHSMNVILPKLCAEMTNDHENNDENYIFELINYGLLSDILEKKENNHRSIN